MKKSILLIYLIFNLGMMTFAQEADLQNQPYDDSRIASIENKLQILSVEVKGLTEKVNVNISDTTLLNFLKAVSQVHKININLSEDLNSTSIINGFNDVIVQDLLIFLVKEYQLDIDITGNILSIKRYTPPIITPKEKEIVANYDLTSETISMDLRNDPLPKVFRKITEISGKNLLFTPELDNKSLNLYISNVAIDIALKKLAETNDLEFNKTRNGFYEFEAVPGSLNTEGSNAKRPKRNRSNFFYKVVDTTNMVVSVDFKNTPIADIIHDITEDLKLDVFTASPLEEAGTVTVKAERINFDNLLVKVFESNAPTSNSNTVNQDDRNRRQQNSDDTNNTSTSSFTFKKEGNVYYFGTEDQLSVKQIELIQMMHRSIVMLGDANSSGGSFGNNTFVTGGTNFVGSQSSYNSSKSQSSSSRNSNTTPQGAITDMFPATIVEGLDIKIDAELNSFVVSGSGAKVEKFKDFVKYIDKPIPLILIEVMILEVGRSAKVETGIKASLGEKPVADSGTLFPNANITLGAQTINKIIGGFDGFGSLNLGKVVPNFNLEIKAMESNGNIKILSTPKLSTLNGHKAYLSNGETTYYAVTNENIYGTQNPQRSTTVNYQPINAELALEFKPFVSGDGQITLDIQVTQSSFNKVKQDKKDGPPPDINSRTFSSIMRMHSNDVAILGGLEQKKKNDSGSGVPILSRIPIIKWFFSSRTREDSKTKLNVIIKPTVFY